VFEVVLVLLLAASLVIAAAVAPPPRPVRVTQAKKIRIIFFDLFGPFKVKIEIKSECSN
jgi:hypothetical protein